MLEAFEIFSTTGVVLWSRHNNANAKLARTAVNALINNVFIEERGTTTTGYAYEKYTLKYSLTKDLGIIFVAVYQSLLHLTWVDRFVDEVKAVFLNRYRDQVQELGAGAVGKKYDFDRYYDELLRRRQDQSSLATSGNATKSVAVGVEDKKRNQEERDDGGPPPPQMPSLLKVQGQQRRAAPVSEAVTSGEPTPVQSPVASRPVTPLPTTAPHLLPEDRPGSRGSRRARKAANTTSTPISGVTSVSAASSGDETRRPKTPRNNTKEKKGRIWGHDGSVAEDDGTVLDYSKPADSSEDSPPRGTTNGMRAAAAPETFGTRNKQGQFVLKDLDDEIDSILKETDTSKKVRDNPTTSSGGLFGSISGYFSNIVGGKTLTKQDLEKPLRAMEEHLIKKNVAREAAIRLCQGVEHEMIGKKTASFQTTEKALQPALENSLRRLLTPKTSLDLLREIDAVRKQGRPYVMSIVGVNGVGKSTNLSKICYFLLQNKYRVLIVAGDTFRSGAVEQLGVHVRNLKELIALQNAGEVELYQKGYGMDAANLAKSAVEFATKDNWDIVLIDTAGRAHNNTTLMSQLEKFGNFANPDKILQVAEALVGNDSVNQARNFNQAFGRSRGLDGFIISKCDTVGDQIGTIVSMVAATGIPVVFLGVGQHYQDLRQLSIPWAVKLLMN